MHAGKIKDEKTTAEVAVPEEGGFIGKHLAKVAAQEKAKADALKAAKEQEDEI